MPKLRTIARVPNPYDLAEYWNEIEDCWNTHKDTYESDCDSCIISLAFNVFVQDKPENQCDYPGCKAKHTEHNRGCEKHFIEWAKSPYRHWTTFIIAELGRLQAGLDNAF